jgi:tripartite-type tricarboxylate transporter receptor subunit TctC
MVGSLRFTLRLTDVTKELATTQSEAAARSFSSVWFGVGAPKAAPAETIDKLNKAINAGIADPRIKAHFADLGGVPFFGSPPELRKFVVEEAEKWGEVIRAANIKAE